MKKKKQLLIVAILSCYGKIITTSPPPHFYYPVLGTDGRGGGRKTYAYRDNHQSLPQPTIDTCLQ